MTVLQLADGILRFVPVVDRSSGFFVGMIDAVQLATDLLDRSFGLMQFILPRGDARILWCGRPFATKEPHHGVRRQINTRGTRALEQARTAISTLLDKIRVLRGRVLPF